MFIFSLYDVLGYHENWYSIFSKRSVQIYPEKDIGEDIFDSIHAAGRIQVVENIDF